MKKTLVALASLAAFGAYAQSSVTMSGRVDMGLNQFSKTETVGANSYKKTQSDLTGAQNSRTTSRITFSGTEDLGGGLKANFNLETGLNPSDDSGLFAGSTRTGLLSLSGGFGTVGLGTYLNSMDTVRGFSAATFNAAGGDFLPRMTDGKQAADLGSAATTTSIAGVNLNPTATAIGANGRSRNAVFYATPNYSGFTGSIGFNNQKNVTNNVKNNGVMASAAYANGPLSTRLTVANGKVSNSVTGVQAGKVSDVGLAISYDLGIAKPYFIYETAKTTTGTGPAFLKATGYELGATFALGAFRPYVSLGNGDHKNNAGKIAKQSAFQVGTLYDISKRTYLYGSIGNDKVKSSPIATVSSKRSGLSFGLVHSF